MLLVCELEMLDTEAFSCIFWEMAMKIGRSFSAEIITDSCFWRALQTLIGGILRWNIVITSVNAYR